MNDNGDVDAPTARSQTPTHALQVDQLELVGGGRTVQFNPGLNVIRGDISTGKTTLVRLLRALLGTVPDRLPPEVASIRLLRGRMALVGGHWEVVRPLVTGRNAPVELARRDDAGELQDALRVPAVGQDGSYSRFLLDRLSLPAAAMPRARRDPASGLSPVTASDWLGYCIVTGEELDSEVFGHRNPWRDQKRRWIFEQVYGYYDSVTAELAAELRGVELRLDTMDRQGEIIEKFVADTPFGDRNLLLQALEERSRQLQENGQQQIASAQLITAGADVSDLRGRVLALTEQRDLVRSELVASRHQLQDLADLHKQLQSQAARLTRAIVADEWLVDFDFLVCPRCGSDVEQHRVGPGHCYLCLQPEQNSNAPDVLMAEQDRLAAQLTETEELIGTREEELLRGQQELVKVEEALGALTQELNSRTEAFISSRVDVIRTQSAQEAFLRADVERINEYLVLLDRQQETIQERTALAEQAEDLRARIESRTLVSSAADDNVEALEGRLLEYLQSLHIPQLGNMLTVKIEGPAWLPTVSGRTFDELSSQGLKTLVNAAHALAHHTVAIDRGLPLPGFLVLDGLSANAGKEGYDGDRVEDLYRLLMQAADDYAGLLQLVVVDNELPHGVEAELADRVILTLSQDDRLIRADQTFSPQSPPEPA